MARLINLVCEFVIALTGLVAFPAPVHAVALVASRDKAAIEALESNFAAAVNAKDLVALMHVYSQAPDLFLFDVNPPRQYVGWSAIKSDWEGLFKAFPGPLQLSISDLSITVVGPVAYGHNIQEYLTTRANGSRVHEFCRVTDVYRKIHGRWLIVQEHASMPVDYNTFKADLLSRP